MKALRKKYGKRPWIDTPNAAWYRKRCSQVKAMRAIMCNAAAHISYSQFQAIRSVPSSGPLDNARKSIALAECAVSSAKAINAIFEAHTMPDPNRK